MGRHVDCWLSRVFVLLCMRGMRRDSRFALSVPWDGKLRVPADVVVERHTGDEVWIVSTRPVPTGEVLTLELTGSEGRVVALTVRVVESTPVLREGAVRHSLRLAIEAIGSSHLGRSEESKW
jgi:hypothetical protein